MNDNLPVEGPNHAAALALINDLMLVLANASRQGLERYDANGEPVYDFAFWSNECAKIVGVRKVA
jgi:hypothetical protein